jgi:hypothetical protein
LYRKRLSIILSMVMVASLMALVAPTASQAQQAGQRPLVVGNLMPNQTYSDKDQLSNKFDGVDSAAHLTAITSPNADRVTWFVCASTATSPAVGTANCRDIGTDASGIQPRPANPAQFDAGSYRAFDITWNMQDVPTNIYNIVTRACAGAPSADRSGPAAGDQNTVPENCRDTVESLISVDNVATTFPPQPGAFGTGEIVGICIGTTAECLPTAQGGTGTGTFQPATHGGTVPTDSFSVSFRTSSDVTAAGACLATFSAAPAAPGGRVDPSQCQVGANSVTETTPQNANFRQFVARFQNAGLTNNVDYDLAIFGNRTTTDPECTAAQAGDGRNGRGRFTGINRGNTGGTGFNAATVCVFDEHYVVARAAQPGGRTIVATFPNQTTPGPVTANCQPADTEETNRQGTTETVFACVRDELDRSVGAGTTVTFESTGVGTLVCQGAGAGPTQNIPSGGGTPTVQPSAGDTQRCTAVTDVNGRASAQLSNGAGTPTTGNRAGQTGTQNVVACLDQSPATNTRPAGCADEAPSQRSAVTKTWIGQPTTVALVFQRAGAQADSCAGGDSFKVNNIGDNDTLLACVFDDQGRPTTTQDPTGTDQGQTTLSWFNSAPGIVAFTTNPPSETGPNGTATVGIRALAQGSSTITVTLNRAGGDAGPGGTAQASVTKSVQSGPGGTTSPGPTQTVTITPTREQPNQVFHDRTARITNFRHISLPGKRRPALRVRGDVRVTDGFDACRRQVPVKIQIRLGGEWITRKSDTTNDNGVFRVLIRDIQARYRVTAVRHEIADVFNNDNHICKRARGARRHRH